LARSAGEGGGMKDQKLIINLYMSIHVSQLPDVSPQVQALWERGQELYQELLARTDVKALPAEEAYEKYVKETE